MNNLSTAIALPTWVVAKLWEWQGHGGQHPVVGCDEYWTPPQARYQLEADVLATLEELGLARGQVLVPELRDMLRVLANAEHEYFGWLADASGALNGVLVASAGRQAVRLLRDDRMVVLEQAHVEVLAASCVEALPEFLPAVARPLRAREAECFPRTDGESYQVQVMTQPGAPDPRRRLKELTAGTRAGVHRLYAATRASGGSRMSSKPITVLDIVDRGRIACYVSTPANDEPHLNCVPGGPAALIDALGEVHHALTEQRKVR